MADQDPSIDRHNIPKSFMGRNRHLKTSLQQSPPKETSQKWKKPWLSLYYNSL